MATEVEQLVRAEGAVPATIAVLDGRPHVGLDAAQLRRLATTEGVFKATTRDLPWLMATGATGATTVAATMRIAALAGIRVFATGGIGGVHRGASTSFDVSADLTELATTPVAVVSAGIKSILDIGSTLERLETAGVPVVVNGSDDFPSFYSRTSGLPAPRRLDGPVAIARLLHATWDVLGLSVGREHRQPDPSRRGDPVGGDRRRDRRGPCRARPSADHRTGGHPVPARPRRRTHRRPQPRRPTSPSCGTTPPQRRRSPWPTRGLRT